MDGTDLIVEVRDKALVRVGQLRDMDLDILIEDQFNNVGSWQLKVANDHHLAAALRTPGSGIIVTRKDGSVLFSGLTIKAEVAATSTDPGGTVTVEGISDTALLADRVCFPEPGNLNPETQTLSHDVRTGSAETLMHEYVNANIGPSAPVSGDPNLGTRRHSTLQMGANLGRGPVLTKRARFNVLGNLLNELAVTAGLGFRVVQVGNHLEFQTFATNDRTALIRLDIRNNMLAGHRSAVAPPGVTRVIAAGQGDLVDRKFVAATTPEAIAAEAEWGRRIELFKDQRQTNEDDELAQAGAEELAENGFSQRSVQIVPMEDFYLQFGQDWSLGDSITAVVEGQELTAQVTGYVIRNNSDGFRMGAILGDPTIVSGPNAQQRIQKLETRVSNLERNDAGDPRVDVLIDSVEDIEDALAGLSGAAPMSGEIRMWAGPSAPSGWRLCDGGAVSRASFAALFSVIGTTYGAGDGTTTFNVPNLKGRVPVGLDSGQTEFDGLGQTGGAKTHTLTQAEMPSHTHTQNAHGHTATQAAHAHRQVVTANPNSGGTAIRADYAGDFAGLGAFDQGADTLTAQPAITVSNATATNQSTGGGGAHNNLQPFLVLNYIIKL